MSSPIHTINDQQNFIKELIKLYKEETILWQRKHPKFTNRDARQKSYNKMVNHLRKYKPDLDEDFIKHKINLIRTVFKKQFRRVQESRKTAKSPNEVYKPHLWYYSLLLFLVGEDNCENSETGGESTETITKDCVYWNTEYLVILIRLFKQNPCLYIISKKITTGYKQERSRAITQITKKLMEITGKHFSQLNVRKRIMNLRCQFFKEYKKMQCRPDYQTAWWPYKLLKFLIPHHQPKDYIQQNNLNTILQIKSQNESDSDESDRFSNLNDGDEEEDCTNSSVFNNQQIETEECKSPQNYQMVEKKIRIENVRTEMVLDIEDDTFTVLANNVAYQLRHMTDEQRKNAERLIKDVMYYGQMDDLTDNSRLILE